MDRHDFEIEFTAEASFSVSVRAEDEAEALAYVEDGLHHPDVDHHSIHCLDIFGEVKV